MLCARRTWHRWRARVNPALGNKAMEMAKKAVIAFSLLAHKDGYFWRNGWRNGWVTAGVTAGVTAVTAVRSLVAVASGEGKQARRPRWRTA